MAFFEGISFVGVIAFLVATSVVSPILPTVANPVLSVTTSVPNAAAKSLGCPMMANTLPASHASVTLLSSPVDPFQQSSIVSSQVGNAMASAVNSHIQQNVANAIAHLTASQSMMAANPLAMAKNPFSHFSSMPAALSIPGMTTTTNSPGRTIGMQQLFFTHFPVVKSGS